MPGLLWLALWLVLPLGLLLGVSFLDRGDAGELTTPWTTRSYLRLLGFGELGFDPLYPIILGRTVLLALGTALGCALIGIPMAFFITSLPARYRHAALVLVVIPLWTCLLIRTYAWQILLDPNSPITRLAALAGLVGPDEALYPGWFAVGLGLVADFLPFFVLPTYASVEKLDWSQYEAARDLGATAGRGFWCTILPQIIPGCAAGGLLVFLPALGQFVVPDLLGGAKIAMLGNVIQQQFSSSRDWPFGSALVLTTLCALGVGLWILRGGVRSARAKERTP